MLIDCHNHIGVEMLTYLRGEFPYAQHLTALHADGLAHGIRRFIVFPFVSHLALKLGALRSGQISWPGEIASVPYACENHRLALEIYELFPEEGKAMMPFVMIDPWRATEEQAEAIRQLRAQHAFYGFKIQSTILQSPIKSLLREGRIFLKLAEEWNLPLLIHSSVSPDDPWAQANDILDIVEQTPSVRFCLAHSCRFDRSALERLAHLPNAWFDCSAHCIHCDLAVQDHLAIAPRARRFPSDYTNPAQVLLDLAQAYPERLLWGSDSPFYSFVCVSQGVRFNLRSTYAREADCLNALPPHLKRRVGCENTLDFLGRRCSANRR